MSTLFNSLNTNFKQPTGPVKKGNVLTLRIKLKKELLASDVQVIFCEYCAENNVQAFPLELESSDETFDYFNVVISNLEINIYHYFFSFVSYGTKKYLKKEYNSWNAFLTEDISQPNWQLTVYEPIKTHPNMNNGIMYQIFPDRFYSSGKTTNLPSDRIYRKWGEQPFYSDENIGSDFFGGDLKGITEKLDYLKKLNVSVIYLNPIWESQSNHRYNTGRYDVVDPVLGNLDDFKDFIKKAHSLGMIVILDTVINHTGSDSLYFNKYNHYPSIGAYQGSTSPYYDWYYFNDDNPDNYVSWWNFKTLPKINQNSQSFNEFMFNPNGTFDFWFSLGVDGLRLDVADELPNFTLNNIYTASKRHHDKIVIIAEVWEDPSNKCNYGHRMNYFLGEEATSVMNYPIRDSILAYIRYGNFWAENLEKTLITVYKENYPKEIAFSLMNFLSSHDTVRAITKLAGKEVDDHDKDWQSLNDNLSPKEYRLGRARLMISYLFLYFLPGIPSIFYGDEIGLFGQKDPFCRKCFAWQRIDKKLLHFFKSLGKLRHSEANFLSDANFDIVKIDSEKCIFVRNLNNRNLYIFLNRTDKFIDISDYTNCLCIRKSLFTLGRKTSCELLDCFGALVIEV